MSDFPPPSSLLPAPPPATADLAPYVERVAAYIHASRAGATLAAYRSDWRDFTRWCREHGTTALPAAPEAVAAYITAVADSGRKVATIQRRLAAIAAAHTSGGHDSPTSKAA